MTPTLSQLLASQEARDAAPCVPVIGAYVCMRDGEVMLWGEDDWPRLWIDGKHHQFAAMDIIWSGDLVAELAAVDALRAALADVRLIAVDAQLRATYQKTALEIIADKASQALKGTDA